MPGKPDNDSGVCVTTASVEEEKDLNCLATVQVTHGAFLEGDKLLSSSSVLPF